MGSSMVGEMALYWKDFWDVDNAIVLCQGCHYISHARG